MIFIVEKLFKVTSQKYSISALFQVNQSCTDKKGKCRKNSKLKAKYIDILFISCHFQYLSPTHKNNLIILDSQAGHWAKSPPTRLIKPGALLHCE